MTPRVARTYRLLAASVALLLAAGCVERTIRVTSNPPGARVFLNDEEIGVTPVRTSFLWYGDYDLILRKEGYETLATHYRVNPPWYELPPFDLVAECLIPGTVKDGHVSPTYELRRTTVPDSADVVQRAVQMRESTVYEGP